MIRAATLNDIEELVRLEQVCFDTDKLSRRSFRHMLTRAHAANFVYEAVDDGKHLCGYIMVLFHAGTSLARVYSIAVDPQCRGQGIGRKLAQEAERESFHRE